MLIIVIFSAAVFSSILDYVDPFIGTGGHGHTFPGVSVPFGMIKLSPDTDYKGWDWCSGYHYTDETIMGFSHTHLSGTGAADYGEVRIMPIVGELKTFPGPKGDTSVGYRSKFSHEREVAMPGYYSVYLDDYNVFVELTASTRVGFHRYTFPKTKSAYILIDLFYRIGSPSEKAWVKFLDNQTVVGYIVGGKFCGSKSPHTVYFVVKFLKPFENFGTWKAFKVCWGNKEEKMSSPSDGMIGAFVKYSFDKPGQIILKVAISYTGIKGALKNLSEVPGWDFDKVKEEAQRMWEDELNKVKISASKDVMIKFYTALYHAFLFPNIFSDVDGSYIGPDNKVYKSEILHYTVFSLWDTFRALHPLFNIIQPTRSGEMINTLIDIYEEGGWLPKWYKANRYTNCMIGTHADSVISEAVVKGIKGFNVEKAYKAVIKDAYVTSKGYYEARGGLQYYIKYGYVPADRVGEATSRTLEFSYDDFCIAQFAKIIGKQEDYEDLMKRSKNYKNVFDKKTGFMRGKRRIGFWMNIFNFDPTKAYNYYTEGNAWQWTFFVPHDVYGLINLMGGKERFIKKLDQLFTTKSHIEGPPDITGLIGQYAHGNEPSHHIPYLYVYAGAPWKTQRIVRYIMENLYGTSPEGLCGNEDCGQMSAWFIFSALGFYPVCPCIPYYIIGSPYVQSADLYLENGKVFKIRVKNYSKMNVYIKDVYLNGRKLDRLWITHEEIMNGGTLLFVMTNEPVKNTNYMDIPK